MVYVYHSQVVYGSVLPTLEDTIRMIFVDVMGYMVSMSMWICTWRFPYPRMVKTSEWWFMIMINGSWWLIRSFRMISGCLKSSKTWMTGWPWFLIESHDSHAALGVHQFETPHICGYSWHFVGTYFVGNDPVRNPHLISFECVMLETWCHKLSMNGDDKLDTFMIHTHTHIYIYIYI